MGGGGGGFTLGCILVGCVWQYLERLEVRLGLAFENEVKKKGGGFVARGEHTMCECTRY